MAVDAPIYSIISLNPAVVNGVLDSFAAIVALSQFQIPGIKNLSALRSSFDTIAFILFNR